MNSKSKVNRQQNIKKIAQFKHQSLYSQQPNYILRCIEGCHKGKFVYINKHQPETIGSEPQCTLCIEDAAIQPSHCTIFYNPKQKSYKLVDCSKSGTWIKMSSETSYTIKQGSQIQIEGQFFEFIYGQQIQTIRQLFDIQSLQVVPTQRMLQAKPADLIGKNNHELMKAYNIDQKIADYIRRKTNSIFGKNKKPVERKLILQNKKTKERVAQTGWLQNRWNYKCNQQLVIDYFNGQYILGTISKKIRILVKNLDNQIYLTPDLIFVIGQIRLIVQKFNTGQAQNEGTNSEMLDISVIVQNLITVDNITFSYFAIYDGHGNSFYVHEVQNLLHQYIKQEIKNLKVIESAQIFQNCIDRAFKRCDQMLKKQTQKHGITNGGGCTVNGVLIFGKYICCFNAGDSRTLLKLNQGYNKLSYEHRTSNESQAARLQKLKVSFQHGKIFGSIAVTRSLGDFGFKYPRRQKDIVIAEPQIIFYQLEGNNYSFLLISSDGVFDFMEQSRVLQKTHSLIFKSDLMDEDPEQAASELIKFTVKNSTQKSMKKTCDNVSAIIILLSVQNK